MFFSPARLFCRACNRNLPRAASRCPWCKTPLRPGGQAARAHATRVCVFRGGVADPFAGERR